MTAAAAPLPAVADPAPVAAEPAASGGNPLIAGLPGFTIGSIALALQGLGYVPATAASVVIIITFGASAISTLIATIWAARTGDNIVAVVFVTFTGFWVSYSLLVFFLTQGLLKIPAEDVTKAQGLFLFSWLFVLVTLTLGTLKLPSIFTLTLVLVDLSVVFNLLAVLNGSAGGGKAAGVCALGYALIGSYLMVGAIWDAAGGKMFPLGRAVLRA